LAQSPGSQLRLGLVWPRLELALGLHDSGGLAARRRRRPRPGYSNSLMSGGYLSAGGMKSKKTQMIFLFFSFFSFFSLSAK